MQVGRVGPRKRSGIPRSTGTSREPSPSRYSVTGATPPARGLATRGATAPGARSHVRPTMTEQILRQSREAESALADALVSHVLFLFLVFCSSNMNIYHYKYLIKAHQPGLDSLEKHNNCMMNLNIARYSITANFMFKISTLDFLLIHRSRRRLYLLAETGGPVTCTCPRVFVNSECCTLIIFQSPSSSASPELALPDPIQGFLKGLESRGVSRDCRQSRHCRRPHILLPFFFLLVSLCPTLYFACAEREWACNM